jgi:acetolactate synthase I/II/III large subunit
MAKSDRLQRGADIIGHALAKLGATHAFGIPGGEVLALMQGLNEAGLKFVLVKHENNGGFFAEGHWHMTGALPVLIATLGPGVANAVNVVANAMQDRVPLIFLTGCIPSSQKASYTHQVFDHQAVLRPLVKGTFRLERNTIEAVMTEAVSLALSGQLGPVHIDVPIDVAEAESIEQVLAPLPMAPSQTAQIHVQHANALLSQSLRPLAIAGVDAVNANAGEAIQLFCKAHNIPLITTYKGKGLLDETDPRCIAGAGLSPRADAVLLPLIAAADTILLIGYDPIEMRIGWHNPWKGDQSIIEITPASREHGMHRVDVTLTGNFKYLLEGLAHNAPRRWVKGEPQTAKAALGRAFSGSKHWGPHLVFRTLREVLPSNTIATADSGAHRILFSQIWTCNAPRSLLQSSGLCTMACALPLAAGAKLGRLHVPVLCVIGDAGLDMCIGELATLRDLKLPVIICVLVDESLALIELKQRGTRHPNLGVDFGRTDFAAVASAYGGHGIEVNSEAALRSEVQNALKRPAFSVIAARIPPRAYDGAF